jgi:hypothetical protein
MRKILVVDSLHTDINFPIRLRLKLSRAVFLNSSGFAGRVRYCTIASDIPGRGPSAG